MPWELEREEVDLAEGVHRHILVNKDVIGRDGEPVRHHFYISLGSGSDGHSCSHCNQPIKRTLKLHDNGELHHHEHGKQHPRDMVNAKISELNDFHNRMHAYIRHHKATHYKGPKK